MTDKPTAPNLAALSAAATGQEPEHLFNEWDDLTYTLVNEYRAGHLVQIDEGMRDRVALAMFIAAGNTVATWGAFESTRMKYRHLADAAIAAMMGGAK